MIPMTLSIAEEVIVGVFDQSRSDYITDAAGSLGKEERCSRSHLTPFHTSGQQPGFAGWKARE
jgi:hypothetical protein